MSVNKLSYVQFELHSCLSIRIDGGEGGWGKEREIKGSALPYFSSLFPLGLILRSEMIMASHKSDACLFISRRNLWLKPSLTYLDRNVFIDLRGGGTKYRLVLTWKTANCKFLFQQTDHDILYKN